MHRNFNYTAIVALLVMAIFSSAAAQEGGPDSLSQPLPDAYRYADKSPAVAFMVGLVPGFFLHGAGHYYIADKKTGSILMVSEMLSIPIILAAVADELANIDTGNGNRLLQGAGGLAAIAFVGGWVVDFLGAPNKVIDSRRSRVANPKISLGTRNESVMLQIYMPF